MGFVRSIVIFIFLPFLASCATGYQSFYKPADGMTPEIVAAFRAAPPPASPTLERSASVTPNTILEAYAKRGYVMIGSSMFNSGKSESETSALKQGRVVGADIVLVLNPQYTGSVTTSIPLTTPTSTTSYTTGTATAFGAGAPVTAYGNATTTTYGTRTTYIPMTVNRSDYGAVYFVKQRFSFGAFTRDLNDSERRELETNLGAVVIVVVDESPAFYADILTGDIIAAIDAVSVPNAQGLNRVLREQKGKDITITLIRHGQHINKVVKLNN